MTSILNRMPSFRKTLEGRPGLKKIVDNIGWLFFDRMLRLVIGLLVGIWVARYLGPEQYGILNYALSFVALFAIFVQLGLQSVVVRDLVNNPEMSGEILGSAAALQVIGGTIAYGGLIWTVYQLRGDQSVATAAVSIFGLTLLFKASETAKYWFEAHVNSKYVVWVSNIVFIFSALGKIAVIVLGGDLLLFVWINALDAIFVGIGVISAFFIVGGPSRYLRVRWKRVKSLFHDSWPLFLAGAAVIVYMKIDIVMLSEYSSDTETGIYAAATKISEIWYFVPMIVISSIFPALLSAKKHSEALYYSRLQTLFDALVWASIGCALVLTFSSGLVVQILFGAEYAGASDVLSAHIWAAVFVFLGVASGRLFIAEGLQMLSLYRALAGAVINVALNLLLIPEYGAIGAAWATVLSYAVSALFFDLIQKPTRHLFRMKLKSFDPVGAFRRVGSLRPV